MTMSSRQMPAGGDRAGRMPDFMIVGHPKCGTTALHHMLRRHPQIFMPDLKETWFFVPELQSRLRRPGRRPDTLEEYMQQFGTIEDAGSPHNHAEGARAESVPENSSGE